MKFKKSKDPVAASLATWLTFETVQAAAKGITLFPHTHSEPYVPIHSVGHAVFIVASTTTSTQG